MILRNLLKIGGWQTCLMATLAWLSAGQAAPMLSLRAMPGQFAATFRTVEWRLVPSPVPHRGAEYESLMQVADSDLSDFRLAGMTIRCHASRLETLFILAEPVPPATKVHVELNAKGRKIAFSAQPIPTGAGVEVPLDIVGEIRGLWRDADVLNVSIGADDLDVKGVISLEGLPRPLDDLEAACHRSLSESD